MRRAIIAIAALTATTSALAQTPAGAPPVQMELPADFPKFVPREKGLPLALAIEAAQAAVSACHAKGYKIAVLVADSGGVPIAMLADDGSPGSLQYVATAKAATTLRYKVASGVITERIKTDAALKAEAKADPNIKGLAWPGALPIMMGGEMAGAIGVSGAPGGEKDEACAQAGLDAIAGKLK